MSEHSWPWDVDIDTTQPALARAMSAVLLTGSRVSDLFRIRPTLGLGRGISAFLRVQIPDGSQERFRELCRPIQMRPPSRVQIGCEPVTDDGHPGRERKAPVATPISTPDLR